MKRLMIFVAVAILGVVANAATVKWQVTNIQGSPDASVASGWVVEIYSATVAYDYAKAAAGEISSVFSGSAVENNSTFRATGTVADGQANGTTESYYMVIYDASTIADAKNYIISGIKDLQTNAAGSDATLSFGSMKGTTSANMFLNSSWQAVPEPTSGLLMLVGLAGLALRRKRS